MKYSYSHRVLACNMIANSRCLLPNDFWTGQEGGMSAVLQDLQGWALTFMRWSIFTLEFMHRLSNTDTLVIYLCFTPGLTLSNSEGSTIRYNAFSLALILAANIQWIFREEHDCGGGRRRINRFYCFNNWEKRRWNIAQVITNLGFAFS